MDTAPTTTSFKFGTETFRPICIPGNKDRELPVEFDLCSVGGASRARLKSIIIATSGLASAGEWSPEVQDAVIRAFETGAPVFAEGVLAVRRLTAPAALCLRVGILRELPHGMDPQSEVPITNGYAFSQLCGYWPMLAYEVGLALARLSGQSEIDPRFFAWLFTAAGISGILPGIAAPVERRRASGGTAGRKTTRARRSTKGTSRRSES